MTQQVTREGLKNLRIKCIVMNKINTRETQNSELNNGMLIIECCIVLDGSLFRQWQHCRAVHMTLEYE